MTNIVLTGFMGTGKTAVGREVARRLGRPFVDMDAVIEARAGRPISRIFSEEGEPAFRRMESDLCGELAGQDGAVIATGGGALVDPANREGLAASSILVCLQAGVDEILERVGEAEDRPLLSVPDPAGEVRRLLAARRDAYAAIPWQVDTNGQTPSQIADEIVALASCRTLPVTTPGGRYDIHIGTGILSYLGGVMRAAGIPEGTRVAVVSNTIVGPLYIDAVQAALTQHGFSPFPCILPDGEEYKTLATVRELYEELLAGDLDRSGVVLALGGGVTGDMAGFAAATFMRGIRFVQVPTTLLSMTDASVGGKTGVDLPQGKNLVGAFKQPELVFVDLAVLETLPAPERRSGMAEVLKHGVIGDAELFHEIAGKLDHEPARSQGATADWGAGYITPDLLARSIQVKIEIVQQDPFERGRRAVLNLGHTTGHALERLSRFSIRHGEGVAIGMVAAARISEALGWASPGLADEIAGVQAAAGLPVTCPALPATSITAAMRHDKKRRGKRLRWVLPTEIGTVVLADDVSEAVVLAVLRGMGAEG